MGLFGGDAPHDDYLKLEARVAALESTVAWLAARATGEVGDPTSGQAGAGQAPPWVGEVRALKDRGQAIAAIKRVRELTGWGLKEAKDYVDGL